MNMGVLYIKLEVKFRYSDSIIELMKLINTDINCIIKKKWIFYLIKIRVL